MIDDRDELFFAIRFPAVWEEEFERNLLIDLLVFHKQHEMYHNNRNNDHGSTYYSLEKKTINKNSIDFSNLPGEMKNVLARSSVARSRISRVMSTNRPINGGTR